MDYKVDPQSSSAIEIILLNSGMYSDFAAEWSKHNVLTENFKVDEKTYSEFQRYVEKKQKDGDIKLEVLKVLPTLMLLPNALDQLVQTTNQLACVIDEYGGFAGVLTIEDLAMEIVGDITDEHDAEVGDAIVSQGDDTWIMAGDVHLDEVSRMMLDRHPRSMPVMDAKMLMGVISLYDVAKAVVDSQNFENKMLKAYIRDWPEDTSEGAA